MKKTIGIKDVKAPSNSCTDAKCPFHGTLSVRGRMLTGKVISSRMGRTVNVEWERRIYVPKYERYLKKRSRVKAHNPDCIAAKDGDMVRIGECRQLSKTKQFTVLEKL